MLEYSNPIGVIIGKLTLIGKLTEEVEALLRVERTKRTQVKISEVEFTEEFTLDHLVAYAQLFGISLIL